LQKTQVFYRTARSQLPQIHGEEHEEAITHSWRKPDSKMRDAPKSKRTRITTETYQVVTVSTWENPGGDPPECAADYLGKIGVFKGMPSPPEAQTGGIVRVKAQIVRLIRVLTELVKGSGPWDRGG
jgi:hypothetical protein